MASTELERSPSETAFRGQGPVRLLAVRLAGAPFASPYDLRSPAFESLLAQRAVLRRALAELREVLVEEIFRAIPQAPDRASRHRLLALKRRIYNDRLLDAPLADVPPGLVEALETYRDLKQREAALFSDLGAEVLREIRAALRHLWEEPRFRFACKEVSTALAADLERKGFPAGGELTSVERGLYAFASRWMSKANPFHLFAEVAFPPASGIAVDGDHEIVLDAADLLALERKLLPQVEDPRRIHLALRPFQRIAGNLVFWVPARPGFRRVARPCGEPVTEAVIDFFVDRQRRTDRPLATLAEWLAAGAGTRESMAELCREGIVEPYLIPDLDRFAESLRGIDPELDPALERLGALHLARVPATVLDGACAALPVRSYVNSYRRLDAEGFAAAAAEVGPTLRALKPFFAQNHNFFRHAAVIRSYFLDSLACSGRDQAPYLEILRHFLRHYQEIIPRYQPERDWSEAERELRARRAERLRRLTGRLDTVALQDLEIPEGAGRSLCFNGPFDFVERVFYLSNIFDGAGRFVGRYLLHRGRAGEAFPEDDDLHVELAVPPSPNVNYVVRRFPTGCGFEARWAHRYESWIDPADVLVAREGAGIAYRDAVSGRRLRFHHSGFQLATLLPTEYQLLLLGHADSFHNPFEGAPLEGHDAGLQVGPVCLRRESWTVGRDFWGDLPRERSSVRCAAGLRDLLWERLAPVDLWYYRWPGGGWEHHKPRFLDLCSPLSASAFQREIAALPADALLSLSPMRPAPAHLHRREGAPVVTELMIEV